MSRLHRFAVLPSAVVVLATLALLVPASAPAMAKGRAEYYLIVNSGHTREYIEQPGHNHQVRQGSVPFPIDFINPHTWRGFTVWEIQFGTTGQCMNAVQIEGGGQTAWAIYEDSCVSRDTNEWFLQYPTGSKTNGVRNFWYINASASAHSEPRTYIYMTARSYRAGALIYGFGPGGGGRAAWNRPCVRNC